MVQISRKLILTVVAVGSFGFGAICILASLFAFNGESFYHDDQIGIQFGQQLDLLDLNTYTWIHVPTALYIKSRIKRLVRFNNEGRAESLNVAELFPQGGISKFGAGELEFEILEMSEEMMPDLVNRDQTISPMISIRVESLSILMRYWMIAVAMGLNNWTVIKFGILAGAVGLIITGGGLLALDLNKNSKNRVVKMTIEETQD